MLQFCPVCKSLLLIKEENGKNIGYCKCGFKRMSGIELISEDKIADRNEIRAEGITNNSSISAEVEHFCKHCKFNKAEVSEIAANESNIFIYKCLKCGNSEREIQGSSKF